LIRPSHMHLPLVGSLEVQKMGIATTVMTLGSDYDASRAMGLRSQIARFNGVDHVDFNYTNNKLTVRFDPDRVSLTNIEALVKREKKHRTRRTESQNIVTRGTRSIAGGLREG
jgi:hypothetical protein